MSFRDIVKTTAREFFQTALISFLIFLFVYIFIAQPHRIRGDSMLPNFANGELLLTEKVSYRVYNPARGDVIVFQAPVSGKVDFIKRIIGLPGDIVKVEDGVVFINDQSLVEPYETQLTQGKVEITLAQNQYYVLGDNRGSSSDSRSFGPITAGAIKGRAWLVYWPIKSKRSQGARFISRVDYGIPDTFYDR